MAQRRKMSGEFALAERADDVADDLSADIASAHAKGSAIEGAVTGILKDRIVGWAWDSGRPYEPLDVELFIGNLKVGHGPANMFDRELAELNRGNGMHRFELNIDRLPVGDPPFVIRAVVAGTETELKPAITIATADDAERLLSGAEYIGRVTGVEKGMLCGWVLNRHNPNEVPIVTLKDGSSRIITCAAIGRSNAAIETGVTANVFRFELPLPPALLDGRQHWVSACVGTSERELAGSPILFGPADVASIGQSVAAALERLQQLDRRVDAIQPVADLSQFERKITRGILDRVDMLLNIHRDGIEREMSVLRRQLAGLIAASPGGTASLIAPVDDKPKVEDEVAPTEAAFSVLGRAEPAITYEVGSQTAALKPSGGLAWSPKTGGLAIAGSGQIAIDGLPPGQVSLVLNGTGARDPLEFCGMVMAFRGHVMCGQVEIDGAGNWSFSATPIEGAVPELNTNGLSISYLPDLMQPTALLTLNRIVLFNGVRPPRGLSASPPKSTVIYLGTEGQQSGWYSVETGPRGGYCWMGARGELQFRVQQTGSYNLTVLECRPLVPAAISKLQLSVAGTPMKVESTATGRGKGMFRVNATCRTAPGHGESLPVQLSFPQDSVRSPMELGMNDDQRPLTISVRSVALSSATP